MKRDRDLYETMRDAIAYLRAHAHERPSVADAAHAAGMSTQQFSRAFARWVGLPPKRFIAHLSHERAKEMLRGTRDILTASVRAGVASPGRLHDLLVSHSGVSPGEFKRGDIEIRWGVHPSPFGQCVIGVSGRGICALAFLARGDTREAVRALREHWPRASLVHNARATRAYADAIFSPRRSRKPFPLMVRGTNFQVQVWKALLSIPEGSAAKYADIAQAIGRPRAVRAVGTACGRNPIGYLIPCHRVLTSDGAVGGYKWGPERKETILAWESARA